MRLAELPNGKTFILKRTGEKYISHYDGKNIRRVKATQLDKQGQHVKEIELNGMSQVTPVDA